MAVQCQRDEFLAGARLSRDENRRAGLRKAPDRAKNFLHRLRLAEDLRQLAGRLERRFALFAVLERAADEAHGLVHIEGLGQVLVGAALECRYGRIQVRVRGHHDDRNCRVPFLHAL